MLKRLAPLCLAGTVLTALAIGAGIGAPDAGAATAVSPGGAGAGTPGSGASATASAVAGTPSFRTAAPVAPTQPLTLPIPWLVHPPVQRPTVAQGTNVGQSTAQQSTNWSGYADGGSNFILAKATWTQPAVTCPKLANGTDPAGKYSSFWVGIDGLTSLSVEQLGTDSDCAGPNNLSPTYYAWYEMYPAGSVELNPSPGLFPVHPGDVLTAQVSVSQRTHFTLAIADTTAGWSFSQPERKAGDKRNSVEWIAEAPSDANGNILPLADFGKVHFSASGARAGPYAGPISLFPDYRQDMVDNLNLPKATTSPLTDGGTTFSVSWFRSS